MKTYEFSYSTRGAIPLLIISVSTAMALVGIGLGLTSQAKWFGYALASFAIAGLCSGVYRFFRPIKWALTVEDGWLQWDSPKYPTSSDRLPVQEICRLRIDAQGETEQCEVFTVDSRHILIPKNCIGNVSVLAKALKEENPSITVES